MPVIDIKDIPQYKEEINLLAYEKMAGHTEGSFNLNNPKGVSIVIGSEGGFDEDEVNYLISQGFKTISLTKRVSPPLNKKGTFLQKSNFSEKRMLNYANNL